MFIPASGIKIAFLFANKKILLINLNGLIYFLFFEEIVSSIMYSFFLKSSILLDHDKSFLKINLANILIQSW